MKRFIVGLSWNWSLYEGFCGVSTDYWIVYAKNETIATAIATAECEEERWQGHDAYDWHYHEVIFCESVNWEKREALLVAERENRDWYPLKEINEALALGTCYAPDGRWFLSQSECRAKYGIELD